MSDRVSCTVVDRVADVRLTRPDKLNALDPAMFDALIGTGELVANDASVRAVVLSGAGRAFCAGLDLAAFAPQLGAHGADVAAGLTRRYGTVTTVVQQAVNVWAELAVPVIAAVHGHALGGGLQLALGADIRIVAPDAQLAVLEIQWGIVPDMAGTLVLPGLVGVDVAKDLTFTGRRISGIEAQRIGLATRVSETPLADALTLARTIASHNPAAIKAAKLLLDQSARRHRDEALRAEQTAQAALLGSPNQREAVIAYFERREPNFTDRD
jgi:enoyl-CoA hydratase/carnithine racemase